MEQSCNALGMDCLELYVSLLDHDLNSDLFRSAVVGLLAAIAVDPVKGILKETYHFTTTIFRLVSYGCMGESPRVNDMSRVHLPVR
jgi:hypothetical protein